MLRDRHSESTEAPELYCDLVARRDRHLHDRAGDHRIAGLQMLAERVQPVAHNLDAFLDVESDGSLRPKLLTYPHLGQGGGRVPRTCEDERAMKDIHTEYRLDASTTLTKINEFERGGVPVTQHNCDLCIDAEISSAGRCVGRPSLEQRVRGEVADHRPILDLRDTERDLPAHTRRTACERLSPMRQLFTQRRKNSCFPLSRHLRIICDSAHERVRAGLTSESRRSLPSDRHAGRGGRGQAASSSKYSLMAAACPVKAAPGWADPMRV